MTTQPNTSKLTLRKNDNVQVIAGREKGKTGKIVKIDRAKMQVTIEKVNMVKRHTRPTQQAPQGGILEKEAPVHYSNVLLYCGRCNRGVRHGIKAGEAAAAGQKSAKAKGAKGESASGIVKKIRVCKKCGSSLETQ